MLETMGEALCKVFGKIEEKGVENVGQMCKDVEAKLLLTNELEERGIKEHMEKGRGMRKEYRKRVHGKTTR